MSEASNQGESRSRADPVEEGLSQLAGDEQALVAVALEIAGSPRRSWRERYEAGDRALRALGAARYPKGRRRRNSIYTLPCGCKYELYYAAPSCITQCAQHPGQPLASADVVHIGLGCLNAILTVILITSLLAVAVGVSGLLSGDLDPFLVKVTLGYAAAGGVSWLLARLIQRRL